MIVPTGARLVVVSGKGGTGKTTVAAAAALDAARAGRRTLLVEVEGRQGIARAFGVSPFGYAERPIDLPGSGGRLSGLAVDPDDSLREYLSRYGAGALARILSWAKLTQVITAAAPGIGDVLLVGKVYEAVTRRDRGATRYDLVVLDAPPTGRLARFLRAPETVADLARIGPIRHQADRVEALLDDHVATRIVLVTVAEELAVTETLEAAADLRAAGLALGPVVVNRMAAALPAAAVDRLEAVTREPELLGRAAERAGAAVEPGTVVVLGDEASRRVRTLDREHRLLERLEAWPLRVVRLPELPVAVGPEAVAAGLVDLLENERADGAPATTARWAPGQQPTAPADRAGRRRAGRGRKPAEPDRPGGPGLDRVVRGAEIVVCCGAGGVGKTSTAAALALHAAEAGRRVCVLTIDPAKRLAQALGLEELGNTPGPVALDRAAGRGSLDAMMLDMRRTFDDVIARYARDAEQAQRIYSNRFYQQLSSTLAGTQEYMAMEKLYELHEGGRYELLVVDTPPTRSALDFLDAPNNLTDLLDGRFLRLLIGPAQRVGRGYLRGLNLATNAAFKMASRVTGSELMAEVGEFFTAFEGMYDGFKQRARRVYELLEQPGTAFVVVATPDRVALREAGYFAGRLAEERMPFGAFVVNRVHRPEYLPPLPITLRRRLTRLGPTDPDVALLDWLLSEHDELVGRADAEQAAIAELLAGVPAVTAVQVPLLADEVYDLTGLRLLARSLFTAAATAPAG